MTPKQQQFVLEYLIDLNATQAAIRAGYSQKTAKEMGYENLTKPHIASAIASAQSLRAKTVKIDAEWVLKQAVELHNRCMQTSPVTDKDGNETGEYKFEHSGAAKSLELIGKHVGIQAFKERIEHSGTITHESALDMLEHGSDSADRYATH